MLESRPRSSNAFFCRTETETVDFPGEYNNPGDVRRLVEFCQCVGSDGASRASNQDRVSLRSNTTSRFVGGEVLGVFVHEVLHLLHRIIQLSRDTGRCEIMDEFPKSGDGGILVNKFCRDPWC
jgi:hypothetical protein